ncbi:hypothetical protein [Kribbella deserti]|uniref:Uncharacterized protein n=1 Tax=Kribbella deserti TaxID=1926257 RepID=A0ABV6QL29_9ACTN
MRTLDIHDDDGILALVDLASYQQEVDWVLLDPDLIDHFERELQAGHAIVWQTSPLGGGEFEITFVDEASDAPSHRELTGQIDVTDNKLYLVNYTDLTSAADGLGRLPGPMATDWFVEVPNGSYAVTIRQLFDPASALQADDGPSFEIVIAAGATATATGTDDLFWRAAEAVAPSADPSVSPGMSALLERVRTIRAAEATADGELTVFLDLLGRDIGDESVARAIAASGEPTSWESEMLPDDRSPGFELVRVAPAGLRIDFQDGTVTELSLRMVDSSYNEDEKAHPRSASLFPGGATTCAGFRALYPDWARHSANQDTVRIDGAAIRVMYSVQAKGFSAPAADDDPISLVTLTHRPSGPRRA